MTGVVAFGVMMFVIGAACGYLVGLIIGFKVGRRKWKWKAFCDGFALAKGVEIDTPLVKEAVGAYMRNYHKGVRIHISKRKF